MKKIWEITKRWKISWIQMKEWERYYFIINKDWVVSYMPADVVENWENK